MSDTRISPILVARELCERSKQLRMEGVIARAKIECELAETRMASARRIERSKILLRLDDETQSTSSHYRIGWQDAVRAMKRTLSPTQETDPE